MSPFPALDRLHARVVSIPGLPLFTATTRTLLAIGFLPSGYKKIIHERFTVLPIEHPVGFFFEALYRAGFWYDFIGWGQVIAALLLLHPATALLGAVAYLPIITNIMVITVTMHFQGTGVVTVLMWLGAVYLVAQDWPRVRSILTVQPVPDDVRARLADRRPRLPRPALVTILAAAGAEALYVTAVALRIGGARELAWSGGALAAAAGAIFGLYVSWHARRIA